MNEDFSIVIIPDTQDVATFHPERLLKMAEWIVGNAESLNVKMILHVGDVVNNGALKEEQWQNHKAAFDRIDQAEIPLVFAIGNHDYDNILNENRSSDAFNRYCGMARYKDRPWFGGVFEDQKTENMFARMDIAGRKFLFLVLEFGPRDEVLDWAGRILEKYADHDAIVVTHAYMYPTGRRTQPGDQHNPKIYKGAHGANDGEDVWHKCLKHHQNVKAVFSGHHIPNHISYRFDLGAGQNLVFQSFQNWQCAECGGDARIKVLKYRPSLNQIELNVVNPQTGESETEEGFAISFLIEANHEQAAELAKVQFPN